MNQFSAGAAVGITVAVVVAIIGVLFFRSSSTAFIDTGRGLRSVARGVLGIVSGVLAVVGLLVALAIHTIAGFQFYGGALGAYGVGLFVYFTVRYRIFHSR